MFIIKQLNIAQLHKDNSHKRVMRKYDIAVKYTNKSFGHTFVDYLSLHFYNFMPLDFSRNIITCDKINIKGLLFLELKNNLS